jgi:hypothetical protein
MKNLNKRIIIPSQRVTECQDGIKVLHETTDKFGDYIHKMKKLTNTMLSPSFKRYPHKSPRSKVDGGRA